MGHQGTRRGSRGTTGRASPHPLDDDRLGRRASQRGDPTLARIGRTGRVTIDDHLLLAARRAHAVDRAPGSPEALVLPREKIVRSRLAMPRGDRRDAGIAGRQDATPVQAHHMPAQGVAQRPDGRRHRPRAIPLDIVRLVAATAADVVLGLARFDLEGRHQDQDRELAHDGLEAPGTRIRADATSQGLSRGAANVAALSL